jgi:hypothetical protein
LSGKEPRTRLLDTAELSCYSRCWMSSVLSDGSAKKRKKSEPAELLGTSRTEPPPFLKSFSSEKMMLLAILEAFGRSSAIGTDFELQISLFDFTLKLFFLVKWF